MRRHHPPPGGPGARPRRRAAAAERRHRTRLVVLASVGVVALAACGGADDVGTPAPTSSSATPSVAPPSAAASARATPAAAGPIRVDTPADGAVVARSFTVTGAAVAFEGALLWELRDPAGAAVRTGLTQAGATAPAPFRFTVTAPAAGAYTLRVYEESAKDGAAAGAVDRRVTVR